VRHVYLIGLPRFEQFSGLIGIITPYKEQKRELLRRFRARYGQNIDQHIDINTIDGFQGQEKDIIIMSCVRASGSGIGFLADSKLLDISCRNVGHPKLTCIVCLVRRMNVGLTRAKSSLFVLGHAASLTSNRYWKMLIDDSKQRNVHMEVQPTKSRICFLAELNDMVLQVKLPLYGRPLGADPSPNILEAKRVAQIEPRNPPSEAGSRPNATAVSTVAVLPRLSVPSAPPTPVEKLTRKLPSAPKAASSSTVTSASSSGASSPTLGFPKSLNTASNESLASSKNGSTARCAQVVDLTSPLAQSKRDIKGSERIVSPTGSKPGFSLDDLLEQIDNSKRDSKMKTYAYERSPTPSPIDIMEDQIVPQPEVHKPKDGSQPRMSVVDTDGTPKQVAAKGIADTNKGTVRICDCTVGDVHY
jgi:hypothetical protein